MDINDLPYTRVCRDVEETMAVAADFAHLPRPGEIVLLSGPLGAGKTHFARGFCKGLGMEALYEVDSPTYTVVNHYQVAGGIDHIDLYRFDDTSSLDEIDFEEILAASTIKLIEWPERLADYPCNPSFLVSIQTLDEDRRRIRIEALGQH